MTKEELLEQEIETVEDYYKGFYSLTRRDVVDIIKHFVKWQKEEMNKVVEEVEGRVTNADDEYNAIRYVDKTGNAQLYYSAPIFKYGDKVKIVLIKNE